MLIAGIALGSLTTWLVVRRAMARVPPAFRQLTFRRGTLTGARFSPDGETIVYSAAWEARPQELFSTRPGAIGERALGIGGDILAISKSGEMAVRRDPQRIANWMFTSPLTASPPASRRVASRISACRGSGTFQGGSTENESPEWILASSMCC